MSAWRRCLCDVAERQKIVRIVELSAENAAASLGPNCIKFKFCGLMRSPSIYNRAFLKAMLPFSSNLYLYDTGEADWFSIFGDM